MCGTNTTANKKPASRLIPGPIVALAVAFGSLYGNPAIAQSSETVSQNILDEIIITAQKREQSLQDVPAAVSAIPGEFVRDYLGSSENIRALAARVPSLNIESSNGRVAPRFYIRGLGNIDFDVNANQPVGMVFDEIFLENNVLRSLPLFDIQQVEVLKGPQGSLFGRNTNAGLIKIDSVKPTFEPGGYVSAGYGARDTVSTEFAASGPVAESVAARLSLKYQRRSDWIDNTVNGVGDDFGQFSEWAYRLQFLLEPSDSFTGLVKFHGFHMNGSQPQLFYANGVEQGKEGLRRNFDETVASHDGAPECVALGIPACAGMSLDHFGMAANLKWDLDMFTLTSITGYDTVHNFQSTDVDGGVLDFNIGALGSSGFFSVATGDGLDDHYQFTQEFRLSTETDRTFFQAGLYVFKEKYDVKNRDFLAQYKDIVSQDTDSYALFGQLEYSFTDRFAVTAGLRYTSDEKNLEVKPGPTSPSPPDSIAVDDAYVSGDLAFTFDASDDWSLYGRFAKASRGPVTLGRFGFTSSADTETSDSVEFGFKSNLMGGRARWNSAVYAYVNNDMQLTATGGVANVNQLLNIDKVNGRGVETELEMLLWDNLLLVANASYNHTEIDDPGLGDDLCGAAPSCTPLDPVIGSYMGPFGPVTVVGIDGNPLPRTPEWIYNLILQYSIPVTNGEFYVNTDWNYRGESNLFLQESVEFTADARVLGGLRIGYRSEGLDVALVGRNVTNELTVDGGINFNNLTVFINEPAYWGIEMRYDF
jgi:iron complex outermembrane recepter protein